VPEQKDVCERAPEDLLGSPASSRRHMAAAFRRELAGEEALDPLWKAAYRWYLEEAPEALRGIKEGLFFRNREESLSRALVDALYRRGGKLRFSPSRVEKFSRCPFAHFVSYALRPEERRTFESGPRELGDLYHDCLRSLAEELTLPGVAVSAPESPWMRAEEDAVRSRAVELLRARAKDYSEGLFLSGKEEQYQLSRMEDVAADAAWQMVRQLQQGKVEEIFFELPFGSGGGLPAIQVESEGETVQIYGRIDRLDEIAGGYARVIDYKSGNENFDLREVEAGWRLQLMLYLQAALGGRKTLRPGGVFYFRVNDGRIDLDKTDESKLEAETRKLYRLNGILPDDPQLVENLDGSGFSGPSEILPVRRKTDGSLQESASLLSEEAFAQLQQRVEELLGKLCLRMKSGETAARPKCARGSRQNSVDACRYCDYRSVCFFEPGLPGCDHERF
jgi:ATP-dependent helicase/nuclease subunit B